MTIMNFKNVLKVVFFTVCCMPLYIMAQTSPNQDFLKGLTKGSITDLQSAGSLMLDGETIAVYSPEGKRIKGMELITYFQGGEYTFDPYLDDKKEIKAIVLRKKTSSEEKMIINSNDSDPKDGSESKSKEPEGKMAKAFKATDLNDKTYDLETLKGKIVVLNFWFTKCKPCVMELPKLNNLVDKYSGKNVVFLGITFDDKKSLKEFLAKKTFKYNVVPGGVKMIEDYGVFSYPTHIIIDQDSKIAFSASGLSPSTIDDIDSHIKGLLK